MHDDPCVRIDCEDRGDRRTVERGEFPATPEKSVHAGNFMNHAMSLTKRLGYVLVFV
jgi:hypothetical protein